VLGPFDQIVTTVRRVHSLPDPQGGARYPPWEPLQDR
jgi:hypothetical protein